MRHNRIVHRTAVATLLVCLLLPTAGHGWSAQGHRLVAQIADRHLTPAARKAVAELIGPSTLADVATWADQYVDGHRQTAGWHYVNIPENASAYSRERDCPPQPGDSARSSRPRDCVVDRILFHQERLANVRLDRADRAIALKFLVHLVADVHQPFHAIGVERGGNGIAISVFGSSMCGAENGPTFACNLHALWDGTLIARRRLSDRQYLARLDPRLKSLQPHAARERRPEAWAIESLALARKALLPSGADVDERYYRAQIEVVDDRLVLAGLRLAAVLNAAL
jgi:hypothetical protein